MKNIVSNVVNETKLLLTHDEKIIKYSHFLSEGKRDKKRFYFKVQTNNRNLFIKYAPYEGIETFKKEFEALCLVKPCDFALPQPIRLIKNGIIMSQVEGSSLENQIKEGNLNYNFSLVKKAILDIVSFHKMNKGVKKIKIDKLFREITGNTDDLQIYNSLEKVNLGPTHGDLDPFNTLFDKKSGTIGLIDWEDFRLESIQELDVLHFIIMLGVITNPKLSRPDLYKQIFGDYTDNLYLRLLEIYSKDMSTSVQNILNVLPVYCDSQNYRLIAAGRSTENFLYNEFKRIYYEK